MRLYVEISLPGRAHIGLGLSFAQPLLAQSGRFVRGFPGEVGIFAAEVPVSSGLLINRTAQLERLDNPFRGKLEVLREQALPASLR